MKIKRISGEDNGHTKTRVRIELLMRSLKWKWTYQAEEEKGDLVIESVEVVWTSAKQKWE